MIGLSNVGGGAAGDVIAFIKVTYPAGSVCTCTNGSKTYTAKDTTGTYTFSISSVGSWTVSSTNGTKSASRSVTVAEWESISVALSYQTMLIDNGTLVATFQSSGGSITPGTNYAVFNSGGNYARITYTPIDLTSYSNLTIKIAASSQSYWYADNVPSIGVSQYTPTINASTLEVGPHLALTTFPTDALGNVTAGEYTIDISALSGTLYVFATVSGTSNWSGVLNITDFYVD